MDDLEQKVSGSIESVEIFTGRFTKRYFDEDRFKEQVHSYLKLSTYGRAKLAVVKMVSDSWYRKHAQVMLHDYAVHIREGLVKAQELQLRLQEIERRSAELLKQQQLLQDQTRVVSSIQLEYAAVQEDAKEQAASIEEQHTQIREREQQLVRDVQYGIRTRTDSRALVRRAVHSRLRSSELVRENDAGVLEYDESALSKKLEDMALNDVLDETGMGTSFVASARQSYRGVITHWGSMDDVSEFADIDWVQSLVLSRSRGHKYPTYPYLVTGKRESYLTGRTTIDSAIIVDRSGSMGENNRIVVAQKTCLAQRALMRKLNPNNTTFVAAYNDSVIPLETMDLVRGIMPEGGTATDLALDWLLNTLKDRGPSIAYLISDGAPNSIPAAVAAAKEFQKYPHVMLRLYLIDGDGSTEGVTRKIGHAAGRRTKVASIKNYMLAGGILKDVSQCMGELATIDRF